MENEKKTPRPQGEHQNHKHHRPHKKRGYFIEPTAGTDDKKVTDSAPIASQSSVKTAPSKATAPSEQTANRPAKSDEHPQGNKPHNKHHKHHKNNKPHSAEKEQPQGQPSAKKQEQEQNQNKKAENHERGQQNRPNDSKGGKDHRQHPKHTKNNNNNNRTADVLTPMPIVPKKPMEQKSDDEYEEIRLPALDEPNESSQTTESDEPAVMVEVVGIRFKNSGKTYYFAPGGNTVRKGQYAIVETARGQEYGEVSMGNTMVKESDTVPPLRPIIRIATETDREHHLTNKHLEQDAFRICNEKIAEHGLDMKLIDAQYTFDNSKLLFYFTSAGRVDFRVLVKDLASVFRTRIELRQIGIRDEAKLMGGIGMCGRPLCCSVFLSDFGQVSIKMAKEQNLSLNSAKISGICGRLMCCLRYEHEAYEYEIKRTPPVDSLVRTADGNGMVTEINPLVGTVKVRLLATPDVAPKLYKREDVVMLRKKKNDHPSESKE